MRLLDDAYPHSRGKPKLAHVVGNLPVRYCQYSYTPRRRFRVLAVVKPWQAYVEPARLMDLLGSAALSGY